MILFSFLFEDSNIFQKARTEKSIKLYTATITPELIAKGFDDKSYEAGAVSDILSDGALIGKVVEKTVLNRLRDMNLNAASLGKNASYDIKYTLSQAENAIETGNIEVRVIGKTGIDLSPSATRGAGRKRDPVKTQQKLSGSDFYIFVDLRGLNANNLTYSVYLVLSSYLEDLYRGGQFGKHGSSKNEQIISLLLTGKLMPDSIKELEEILNNIDYELINQELGLSKRQLNQLKGLKNKYQKMLERIKYLKTSLSPSIAPTPQALAEHLLSLSKTAFKRLA